VKNGGKKEGKKGDIAEGRGGGFQRESRLNEGGMELPITLVVRKRNSRKSRRIAWL